MTLQEQLKEYMLQSGAKQAAICRGMGITTGALCSWLGGKYAGNSKNIEIAVENFLKREAEKRTEYKLERKFIVTKVVRRVFEAARIAHLNGEIAVVYGEAGYGKTAACKEYHRENPDSILIEADLGHTARVLFLELHKTIGLSCEGSVHDLFSEVVDKLRGSDRLIIVDEAEHLPYRALELLRRVYDKAGIGILLVGMPRLLANLRGKRGEYAQLYSRVGIAIKLSAIDDIDAALFAAQIPGGEKVAEHLCLAAEGNTRRLVKLIAVSARIAKVNGCDLSANTVAQAAEMLVK